MFGISIKQVYFGPIMKTLIIHPEDQTTDFLMPIYANIQDKTVVQGGVSKTELRELIEIPDRVIMLGHGAPYGLLNPGRFSGAGLFIVDGSMVSLLKSMGNNIYVWCYEDKFLTSYKLSGLCSGMFVSEV
jgi:hypothetical protein